MALSAVAVLVAAGTAAVALGDDGGRAKVRFNATDQAAARAVLLRRGDLRPAGGWTGGRTKPQLDPPRCPNYRPKQSDLVVTGAAAALWRRGGADYRAFGSEATVLRTRRMVTLDWQRSTVRAPGLLSCLRATLAKTLGANGTLLSVRRIEIPRLAPCAAAFRVVWTALGQRVMLEDIGLCRGRTEIEVTAVGPAAARQSLHAAALRLARILVRRARST